MVNARSAASGFRRRRRASSTRRRPAPPASVARRRERRVRGPARAAAPRRRPGGRRDAPASGRESAPARTRLAGRAPAEKHGLHHEQRRARRHGRRRAGAESEQPSNRMVSCGSQASARRRASVEAGRDDGRPPAGAVDLLAGLRRQDEARAFLGVAATSRRSPPVSPPAVFTTTASSGDSRGMAGKSRRPQPDWKSSASLSALRPSCALEPNAHRGPLQTQRRPGERRIVHAVTLPLPSRAPRRGSLRALARRAPRAEGCATSGCASSR